MTKNFEKMKKSILDFNPKKLYPDIVKHALTVPGFSGAAILQVLNNCVRHMPDDFYYLEVGTHRGKTLTGASLRNKKRMIGVDNFSIDFGDNPASIRSDLYKNLSKYSSGCDVTIFPMEYNKFINSTKDIYERKVVVYFYDGDHGLPDQKDHFWTIKPLLADNAIVLIDDTLSDSCLPPRCCARWATKEIIEADEEYSLLRDFPKEVKTPSDKMGFWNGLMVLEFNRKEGYKLPYFKTKFEESVDKIKETYEKMLSEGATPRPDGALPYGKEWIYKHGEVVDR